MRRVRRGARCRRARSPSALLAPRRSSRRRRRGERPGGTSTTAPRCRHARLHHRAGRRLPRSGRRVGRRRRSSSRPATTDRPPGSADQTRARSPGSRWPPSPSWSTSSRTRAGLTPLFSDGDSTPVATLEARRSSAGRRRSTCSPRTAAATADLGLPRLVAGEPWTDDRRPGRWGDIKPAHDNPRHQRHRPARPSPTPIGRAASAATTSAPPTSERRLLRTGCTGSSARSRTSAGRRAPVRALPAAARDQRRRHHRSRGRGRRRRPPGRADRRLPCPHGPGGRRGRRPPPARRAPAKAAAVDAARPRSPAGPRLGGPGAGAAERPSVAPGVLQALRQLWAERGPMRRSVPRLVRAIAVLGLAAGVHARSAPATTAPTVDDPAIDRPARRQPGRLHHGRPAVSPEKIDLLTDLARTFNDQRKPRSTAGACSSARRRKASGAAATLLADGLGRRRRQRPAAGDLVAGVERLGQHPQPAAGRPGQAADGPGQQAVHAHAARDRHAQADGRGARLAGQAARLRGHRRAGQGPAGLGRVRPSRVGPVPARQDQPQLLDQRPQLHSSPRTTPPPARPGPHHRGPRPGPTSSSSPPTSSRRSSTTATPR